jgi:hypothetical protein
VGDRTADFLEECTVDDSLDAPVAQARVRLRRSVLQASLAPLMVDSPLNQLGGAYEPLLRSGRTVVVEFAVSPLGQAPAATDWVEVFRGRVDTHRDTGESVEFSARDSAGLLQDTFIEEERTYGSDTGTPLPSVLQGLLNDNGMSAFGLWVPEDVEWLVGRYVQKKEPVLEALRSLAGQLGADVKYAWRSSSASFGLTLYRPDREASVPAWTYGPGDYTALPDVEFAFDDVRTAATGYYFDSQDKDATGQPKQKRVDRDAGPAALQAYGRRWMELRLGSTDNLDTQEEMVKLLESAMKDLGQPPLGVSVEVALHPFLEVGDLVRLAPNHVQYSGEQTAAVVQWTHTFSASAAKTRLTLRGQPALAPRVWLEKETGRPGAPPTAPTTGPRPPQVLSVQPLVGGLAVAVAPSLGGADSTEYEVHVSTQAGFAVDTGFPSSTLKEAGARTRFELSGLEPGRAYYGRVVARDAAGNRGAPGEQFVLSTRYLSPGALEKLVSYGNLPLNGDFEAQLEPGAPPDGCYLVQGTWGLDAVVDTSTAYCGTRCLRLRANGSRLALQAFVVRPGERLALKAFAFTQTSGTSASLTVTWYDKAFTSVGTTLVASDYPSPGTWLTLSGYTTVPAAARVARVEVATGHYTGEAYVCFDSVVVDPSLTVVPAWTTLRHPSLGGNLSNYSANWAPDTARPPRWRVNALGEVEWQGSLSGGTLGAEAFSLPGFAPAGPTSESFPVRFRVPAGASGTATVSVFAWQGRVVYQVAGANTQVCLDGVRYPVA